MTLSFPTPSARGPERNGTAPPSRAGRDGDLTVVIITRDRCPELLRTLALLSALPEHPPVIVIDNGSSDATVDAVRTTFPYVRLVALAGNFGGAGRNYGVGLATTEFVAFCDDDTWWAPGSLRRAAQVLIAHPSLAIVTAKIVVEPDGYIDPICEEMGVSPLPPDPQLPGAPLLSFLAGASVIRRRAFDAVGGFSPRLLIGGEEELLGTDLVEAGWAMAYLAELEIHHQASTLRDPHLRRRQGIRNTLWYTWLRRPLRSSWRRSHSLVATLPRDRTSAHALIEATRGAGWVASHRRPVSPDVEDKLRLLESSQLQSKARRYVS
jgi:N-acetylglucosaminyl-diphospho-decaprenol L-rhamnosyltransferase